MTLIKPATFRRQTILKACIALIVLVYIMFESFNKGDFYIFLAASGDLFKSINIYEKSYFDGYHYYYSIFFAIVIYPLTFISHYWVNFLWISFNIFLLFRIYKIISNLLPLNVLTAKQQTLFWSLSLLFSARFIFENLHLTQMTIFLVYVCLEGLYLIGKQKHVSGAFLIAFGINIKLMPLVILPYLIYRREFKASFFILVFYLIFMFVPVLFIGIEQTQLLMKSWFSLINPLNNNHILDVDERSFHGLSTLLSTLLVEKVPDLYAMPLKRNIADIDLQTLSKVIMSARLLLIGLTLYFLRTWPFKRSKNPLHRYWELSYVLMIVPLIFPHQQHYAFFFMVPAFLYTLFYNILYYHTQSKTRRIINIVMLSFIYLLTNLKLLLGEFNVYYEHFKILTYGALLLILVLALDQPTTKHSDTTTAP